MERVALGQRLPTCLEAVGRAAPVPVHPFPGRASLSITSVNDFVGTSLLYTNLDNITH